MRPVTRYGENIGGRAASLYERLSGTPGNAGDIALGKIAAQWGEALKNGTMQIGELGERIFGELCNK